MSGPKTSHYTLTPEQRKRLMEQLEKQRQERIRREKINAAKRSLNALRNSIKESISNLSMVSNEGILGVINKVQTVIEESLSFEKTDDITAIHKAEEKLSKVSKELQLALLTVAQEEIQQKNEENEAIEKVIAKGFSVKFEKLPDKRKLLENEYHSKIQKALLSLSDLKLSKSLKVELNRIKSIAENVETFDYLEHFYSVIVFPFVKECNEYNSSYIDHNDEFEEIVAKCHVLAEEIGVEIEDIPEEFSMDALEAIKNKVSMLEEVIIQAEEETYVNKCIDEAMDEMGYHRVGSKEIVTKRTGKKALHELYTFSEGTVVDVTYSEDGQILMQLGAAANEDRTPNEEECHNLVEDMEKFCGEYSVMEEILRRKGIVRKNITMLPPKTEFAQIINVSKYDTTETIETFEVRKKERKKKKYKYMGE